MMFFQWPARVLASRLPGAALLALLVLPPAGDCRPMHERRPTTRATIVDNLPAHDEKSVAILRAKAARGVAQACLDLGTLFFTGQGIERDWPQGHKLYLIAAQKGVFEAQYFLGMCYSDGQFGLVVNKEEGLRWLLLARDRAKSINDRDLMQTLIDEKKDSMKKSQIKKAESLAAPKKNQ